jgi:peptidyl-Lys metalloendopeptidase
MQHGFIAAYITIVVLVAHVYAQDLHVRVIPTRFRFNANQDVEIILNYTNKGSDTVLIYQHYIPKQQLSDPLFEVSLNGTPVQYVGRLVKRSVPTLEDMFQLKPGRSVSSVVQLSLEYDMTKTGNYLVIFKHDIGPMLSTSASLLGLNMSIEAGDEFILQSSAASLFAEGRPNPRIVEQVEGDLQENLKTYSYVSCSSSQQSSIDSALDEAKSYAIDSVHYLAKLTSGQSRYTTWFGTFSLGNLNTLKRHYHNIDTTFRTKSMSFDCGCSEAGVFAYVYPNQPYEIYLCPAFWSAPMIGTDSKGGTIVHETSHFTIVAGTNDYAYGQTACKSLAKSNPSRAIMNADNHEYFTENNPPLP